MAWRTRPMRKNQDSDPWQTTSKTKSITLRTDQATMMNGLPFLQTNMKLPQNYRISMKSPNVHISPTNTARLSTCRVWKKSRESSRSKALWPRLTEPLKMINSKNFRLKTFRNWMTNVANRKNTISRWKPKTLRLKTLKNRWGISNAKWL